jgi:hypothetical protein
VSPVTVETPVQLILDQLQAIKDDVQQLKEDNANLAAHLARIEKKDHVVKKAYTTAEAAERLPTLKSEWSVRQACNKGRIQAYKVPGKGDGEWRISHDEIVRVGAEGPSPPGQFDNPRTPRRAWAA